MGVALAVGITPVAGAIGLNAISLLSGASGGFMPHNALGAGLYTEAWTGFMTKAFKTDPAGMGWYNRIRSFDQYVENDVIHFVNIGGNPGVLINNTTYPISIESLPDADKPIQLEKYQTLATRITDDELYGLSYDKKATVIERHRDALNEKKWSRAISALAPGGNTDVTPVIVTQGAATGSRIALSRTDIVALKYRFDKLKVPMNERILVLCPDHVQDLLSLDQAFAQQFYTYSEGKVLKLYGFEVYEYNDNPYYNATTLAKLAYGAVPAATDNQASIAFALSRVMKANGSISTYAQEAKDNPTMQENLINFRAYSICQPLKNEAIAAIVSGVVPPPPAG
jgi:hypothetical protein